MDELEHFSVNTKSGAFFDEIDTSRKINTTFLNPMSSWTAAAPGAPSGNAPSTFGQRTAGASMGTLSLFEQGPNANGATAQVDNDSTMSFSFQVFAEPTNLSSTGSISAPSAKPRFDESRIGGAAPPSQDPQHRPGTFKSVTPAQSTSFKGVTPAQATLPRSASSAQPQNQEMACAFEQVSRSSSSSARSGRSAEASIGDAQRREKLAQDMAEETSAILFSIKKRSKAVVLSHQSLTGQLAEQGWDMANLNHQAAILQAVSVLPVVGQVPVFSAKMSSD